MTTLTAVWLHGNAVIPEVPEQVEITHRGWGTEVKGREGVTRMWFHVAMPTPVITQGVRPWLQRIMLLGQALSEASNISWLNVYDADNLSDQRSARIGGDNRYINSRNTFNFGFGPIYFGLGITMLVDGVDEPFHYLFTSFGSDWSDFRTNAG